MRVLLKFTHGLGDAVQLTIILRHLQRYRPEWTVYVQSLYGKHSAMHGLCARSFSEREQQIPEETYDKIADIHWHECDRSFENVPSTKAARCIEEVFGITPDPELFFYSILPSATAADIADDYFRQITGRDPINGRWPVVCIHYQGNTAIDKKNLPHSVIALICQSFQAAGLVPVIFDWDNRTPLADNVTVFCPNASHSMWQNQGTGDAALIAALISRASLFVGIDSGPLHVAGATTTPAIGLWTGHTPIRYYDFADNVTHLVPDHALAEMTPQQISVFNQHYRYQMRTDAPLAVDIIALAAALTKKELPTVQNNELINAHSFMVRRNNINQDLTIVEDVYLNDCYKTAIIPQVIGRARVVVDIGAHIGTFAKLVHEKNPNAKIICVEACPENIDALRANVGDFAEIVHAACSYEPGELALCNAVRPDCVSTGGSIVVSADAVLARAVGEYWPDKRPLQKVTLEQLAARFNFTTIDLLKLDCEGSEYSILGNCDISRVGFILGEYHDQARWDEFRQLRFADWDYGHMSQANNMGNFHLRNPAGA